MKEELQAIGVSRKLLAEKVKEGLDAEKKKDEPDWSNRLKYIIFAVDCLNQEEGVSGILARASEYEDMTEEQLEREYERRLQQLRKFESDTVSEE